MESSKVSEVIMQPFERSTALLAAIVESSDDAILSKDLDGTITSWNRAAERIFGYTCQEIVGRSILTLIPEELQGEEQVILRKIRNGERIEHYETIRLSKHGERLELSLTISPVKDETGRTIGASKVARDISERRRMERLLIQSEKIAATGRMAATIAHEINNPLEAVMNLIYLSRTSEFISEDVRGYLMTAEQEIERVSMIARQTLGYFRETTSEVTLGVQDLLTQVLDVYQTKLVSRRIQVERDFQPVRPLTLKRGEITQVFSNLVSNSVDAMSDGGVLQVGISEVQDDRAGGVRIEIKDEGPGIPAELLSRIFEPFFTTKEGRGTGIGLWISRQFVEGRGGSLQVKSRTEGPDRGSRFVVFLPYKGDASTRGELR